MANNMIDCHENLFKSIFTQIKSILDEDFREYPLHDKHCVLLEDEKDFFLDLRKKEDFCVLHDTNVILLQKGDDYYLVINNTTVDVFEPENNSFVEVCKDYNKAIFLLLGAEELIRFKKDLSQDIYDALLYETSNINDDGFQYYSNGIRKHSFSDLKRYFEDFKVFKVTDNSIFIDEEVNIYKLLSFIFIHSNNMQKLPFEEETLLQFHEISIDRGNSFFIPYELVFECLIAIQWKYVYKDLYRCVENLYAFPKAKKLMQSMNCSNSIKIEDIITSLENKLGWRANEKEALQQLLMYVSLHTLDSFLKVFDSDDSWKTEEELKKEKEEMVEPDTLAIDQLNKDIYRKKANYVGKRLYKLRNSLVHFRKALTDEEFSNLDDEKWNILTRSMLMFISEVYDKMYSNT